jgi:three-Cys-motif partner protein
MARRRKIPREEREPFLFELPSPKEPEPQVRPIRNPIWTENKAKLIERYLYYFVLITKHGCYIDGFAGPQEPERPEMWSAKLVLDITPKFLRNFHLFETDHAKIVALEGLKREHADRAVEVYHGDFNEHVIKLLDSGHIGQKEATFCLLDQRTFECEWESLRALAAYKPTGYKIELFYFLANGWLDRALAAQQDEEVLGRWWGGTGWSVLRGMNPHDRAALVASRIKSELGYTSVKPWPIFQRAVGGNIMYFMVHATDHRAAPGLMSRAYDQAIGPREDPDQLTMLFDSDGFGASENP